MAHETTDQRNAGSFLGGVASRLGGFARSVHDGIQAESARRAAARAEQDTVLDTARAQFDMLLADELERYVPNVSAADLRKAGRSTPVHSAPLIEAEMYRIVEILTPLMRQAGFPLASRDSRVRKEMEAVWASAQAAFQQKAFGDVELPRFFVWRGGQLAYEQLVWKDYGRLGRGHYGAMTNFFYGRNRPVLAP